MGTLRYNAHDNFHLENRSLVPGIAADKFILGNQEKKLIFTFLQNIQNSVHGALSPH